MNAIQTSATAVLGFVRLHAVAMTEFWPAYGRAAQNKCGPAEVQGSALPHLLITARVSYSQAATPDSAIHTAGDKQSWFFGMSPRYNLVVLGG